MLLKGKGKFIPTPQGLWNAVCIDVVDLGWVKSEKYDDRLMVQIRWAVDAEPAMKDGRPYIAARSFGQSLGKKSLLRPFLESWRGRKFSNEELEGFDPEALVGVPCQLQILHNVSGDDTYANVQSAVPAARGVTRMEVPADYVRQSIRDERKRLESQPDGPPPEETYEAHDSDVPF